MVKIFYNTLLENFYFRHVNYLSRVFAQTARTKNVTTVAELRNVNRGPYKNSNILVRNTAPQSDEFLFTSVSPKGVVNSFVVVWAMVLFKYDLTYFNFERVLCIVAVAYS